ncbi:unnamed protein product [Parnassius mnemosyne]|uniref:Kinesin motor domain-containing protein n=1 Tax=Parnassius mnemosyne TaxID=213953 RepID=A0AAV1KS78_9NEOP
MSKIPKLPTTTKENRPGPLNSRPFSRTLANGLSDADKKSLLLNHTRPLRSGAVTTVPAPRLKRAATAPSATIVPEKSAKIDKKPGSVAPKIPPYDYKARFNDLLEKHKAIKSEFNDLKDRHVEISDDYEKIKETVQTSATEKDILKEKLLNVHKDFKEKTSELQSLKIDFELTKHENEELQRKTKVLDEVTSSLKQKSLDLDKIQSEFDDLSRRHKSLQEEAEALRLLSEHLKKVSIEYDKLRLDYKEAQEGITKYKSEYEALQNILAGMYKDQRDLRNTVQDLKGNIRVYCRVRPPLESEASKPLFNLNVLDACSIEVEKIELLSSARKGKSQHSFTFDGIFTPHSSQEDVFAEVSSMVQSALDGYNVCIFAYGQTGSGKTYTMEGGCGKENYGIVPRSIDMIFNCMEDLKRMGWELTIKATFLEIYNEVIYDLLDSNKDQESHDIKMVNSKGNDVYVSNLREEEVKSSHDFIRSLSELSKVILSLQTNQSHIPYRNSKLTHLLMPSLGGNSKTLMLVNINQFDECFNETLNSLRFATKVNSCRTTKAKKNLTMVDTF